MNMLEWIRLENGDKIYSYRTPSVYDLLSFNMSIETTVIKTINDKYGFHSTKNFNSLIKAKHSKLLDMRQAILNMKIVNQQELAPESKIPTTAKLKAKFNKIMKQKNVQDIIDNYPEDFI